jgi:hypothetical protein
MLDTFEQMALGRDTLLRSACMVKPAGSTCTVALADALTVTHRYAVLQRC